MSENSVHSHIGYRQSLLLAWCRSGGTQHKSYIFAPQQGLRFRICPSLALGVRATPGAAYGNAALARAKLIFLRKQSIPTSLRSDVLRPWAPPALAQRERLHRK